MKYCVYMYSLQIAYACSSHSLEPLIIEYVISLAVM